MAFIKGNHCFWGLHKQVGKNVSTVEFKKHTTLSCTSSFLFLTHACKRTTTGKLLVSTFTQNTADKQVCNLRAENLLPLMLDSQRLIPQRHNESVSGEGSYCKKPRTREGQEDKKPERLHSEASGCLLNHELGCCNMVTTYTQTHTHRPCTLNKLCCTIGPRTDPCGSGPHEQTTP